MKRIKGIGLPLPFLFNSADKHFFLIFYGTLNHIQPLFIRKDGRMVFVRRHKRRSKKHFCIRQKMTDTFCKSKMSFVYRIKCTAEKDIFHDPSPVLLLMPQTCGIAAMK